MSIKKYLQDKEKTPIASGAQAGGLALAGLSIPAVLKNYALENERLNTPAMDWKKFKQAIQPGDVLFSRHDADAWYKRMIETAGGTVYPHAGVVGPKSHGLHSKFEIGGNDMPADLYSYRADKNGGFDPARHEFVAYRPEGKTKGEMDAAVARLRALKGAEYESKPGMLGRLGKMIAGAEGKVGCGDSLVCTDLAAAAHPDVIPNKFTPATEMMEAMGKPVARMNMGLEAPGALQRFLSSAGGPILRKLKPAAMIGAGTASALALAKFLQKEHKNDR